MKLWCCGCNDYVEAELCGGDIIYPHRPDLYKLKFYRCPHCKNYVGTHKLWGMGTDGRKHKFVRLVVFQHQNLKTHDTRYTKYLTRCGRATNRQEHAKKSTSDCLMRWAMSITQATQEQ